MAAQRARGSHDFPPLYFLASIQELSFQLVQRWFMFWSRHSLASANRKPRYKNLGPDFEIAIPARFRLVAMNAETFALTVDPPRSLGHPRINASCATLTLRSSVAELLKVRSLD